MSALATLSELHRRGARVLASGDTLRVRPGPEGLTDDLRDAIRANKAEIIALLETPVHSCSRCGRFAFPKPTTCYWCRQRKSEVAA
jgi:hypothetical protein